MKARERIGPVRSDEEPIGELRLFHSRSEKALTYFVGGLIGVLAVCWGVFCLAIPVGNQASTEATILLRSLSVLAIPGVIYARSSIGNLYPPPRLRVFADHIEIREPGLLRRPLRIDRADVSAIQIDAEADAVGDDRLRFPVTVGGQTEWLVSSIDGTKLSFVMRPPRQANVAFTFRESRHIAEARLKKDPSADKHPTFPVVNRSSPVPGLLLRVCDPAAASELLGNWRDAPSQLLLEDLARPASHGLPLPSRLRLAMTVLVSVGLGAYLGAERGSLVLGAAFVAYWVVLALSAVLLARRSAHERSLWPGYMLMAVGGVVLLIVSASVR